MPRVMYLLPVIGPDDYFEKALVSVDRDNYPDKGIIVINNGARDLGLCEIVERNRIVTKVTEITCLSRGVAQALNAGLDCCDSEFIARIDADDLVVRGRTSAQVKVLTASTALAGIGSCAELIDEKGNCVGTLDVPRISSLKQMRKTLRFENPYIHPSIMIRSSVLKALRYSEWAVRCQDWNLWIRMANRRLVVGNVAEKWIRYRRHSKQESVAPVDAETSHALKRTLLDLDSTLGKRYMFQRLCLEHQRASIADVIRVIFNEVPNVDSLYSARKLAGGLLRSLRRMRHA